MNPAPAKIAITRRSLLQSAAVSALPFMTGGAGRAEESKPGYIDAHVHVWTDDFAKYPLAEGFKADEIAPKTFTPEELFAECRPHGVNRIVLIQMSFYKLDNRYMLDAIRRHPDSFRGVAIIDEKAPNARDKMDELAKAGVTGFRLYANREAVESWLKSDEMDAMWRHAAKTRQAMCLLANPDALPAAHEMCKRHRETRVVVDHFARIGMDGEIRENDLKALTALAAFPEVYVKTSAFYALGKKAAPYTDLAPMIRRLRDEFGPQRLMWASDCPFQVADGHTYEPSISLIRDKLEFLTPEDKSWMLSRTAERVYWQA
ncbi:MAG TPA: amidohydrolase family protein [Pirellulales bacterium]